MSFDRIVASLLAVFCVIAAPDWLVPSDLSGLLPGLGLFFLVQFFASVVLATLLLDPEAYESQSPEQEVRLYRLAERRSDSADAKQPQKSQQA